MTNRDELYRDVFTTAIEGGVNYWARVAEYAWAGDPTKFHAVIADVEDGDKAYRVDRSVIAKGLGIVAGPAEKSGAGGLARQAARAILALDEDVDYDASDADEIIQAGLFGEVLYG